MLCLLLLFFFFEQKTAYEMRISDWSSDVCSSDLMWRIYLVDLSVYRDAGIAYLDGLPLYSEQFPTSTGLRFIYAPFAAIVFAPMAAVSDRQEERSCRERVCQYV